MKFATLLRFILFHNHSRRPSVFQKIQIFRCCGVRSGHQLHHAKVHCDYWNRYREMAFYFFKIKAVHHLGFRKFQIFKQRMEFRVGLSVKVPNLVAINLKSGPPSAISKSSNIKVPTEFILGPSVILLEPLLRTDDF